MTRIRLLLLLVILSVGILTLNGCGKSKKEASDPAPDRHVQSPIATDGSKDATPATAVLRRYEFRTFGSIDGLFIVNDDGFEPDAVNRQFEDARNRVERVNALMSLYQPGSEVNRLVLATEDSPATLSADTLDVLSFCAKAFNASDGAFDPTIPPVWKLYGFKRGQQPTLPTDEQISDAMRRVGFDKIIIDVERRTGWPSVSGMGIDLGAVAKGYAVDVAYQSLASAGFRGVLVEIGGEMRGSGIRPDGKPFVGGLRHPRMESLFGDFDIPVNGLAIATSGDYEQFITVNGKRYSHIIDARTGRPVSSGLISVTIFAPDCMTADALATTVSVIGFDEGKRMLAADFPGAECIALSRPADNGLLSDTGDDMRLDMTDGVKQLLTFRLRPPSEK
ncbi:MAG: FAD:protein FMN transferase [Planctomycetota bacterium]